ncbi:MAG: GDSL-type esterase/lipase family protein [Planctomycetota bacterium]
MPAPGPQFGFRRAVAATALCGTLGLTGLAADAEPIDVMAIGDSITWGFVRDLTQPSPPSTQLGGWRLPLGLSLGIGDPTDYDGLSQYGTGLLPTGKDPRFAATFQFVGNKGDNNPSTVLDETGRVSQPAGGDDFGDGGSNNTDFLHEGYSGWVIDEVPYGPGDLTDGRQGVLENLVSNGGAIDPGSADVVMLSIGVNDLLRRSNNNLPGYTPDDDVDRLNNLIREIQADAPDATIIVSNILPFAGSPFTFDATNTEVDAFNDDLLARYFGGAFDSNGLAAYDDLLIDDVFLLDVNTLFTDAIPTGGDITDLISTFVGSAGADNLHPTLEGYAALGDIYADAFVNLGIGIPEPSSGLLVVLGAGLAAARRRRA